MGSQVPTFEPQETLKILLISLKSNLDYFYAKISMGLVLRVGSSFLVDPTLYIRATSHTSQEP